MSEITGTPSEGHPFPLNGSQNGDEYGRRPNSRIGGNTDQSTGCPRGGFKIPLKGFGKVVLPSWPRNGVLNCVLNTNVLPPNGGSALNCSKTNCSTGL